MKQPFISIIAILFVSLFNEAQAQTVFMSQEQKVNLQQNSIEVLGHTGNQIYTYRATKEGYYLDAFDDSMKLKATVALDFIPDKAAEVGFVLGKEQIKVIYQTIHNNYLTVYVALLDHTARLMKSPIAIDSVKLNWFSTDHRQYRFTASNDGNMLMLYTVGSNNRGTAHVKAILLPDQLDEGIYSEHLLNYGRAAAFGQVELANDGTFYFCLFPEKEMRFLGNKGWLYCLSADGAVLKEMKMPDMDMNISVPLIKLDQLQQQVYFCATYATSRNGQVDGLVIGRFAPQQDTLSGLQVIAFDDKLRTATDERNKKRAFNDFDVKDMIIKNDGGVLVVTEKFYYTTKPVYSHGIDGFYSGYYSRSPYLNSSVVEYHYGDLLLLDINHDGKVSWSSFIRKEQFAQDGSSLFSSYIMLNAGGSLAFLFNDFTTSRTTVNIAALNPNGSLKLKKLPFLKDIKAELLPRMGKQTDLTELVIPLMNRSGIRYLRIVF